MKPLLLLDVDGVLNCFGSFWSPEYEQKTFMEDTTSVRIPLGTKERLALLAEEFEMVWCTAWEERAHPYFAETLELGDPWPVVTFTGWDGRLHSLRSWKWSFVDRYVDYSGDAPRACAWVDDDLYEADFAWASARSAGGIPTMLVKTNHAIGLADEHVAALLEFADSLKGVRTVG